MRDNGEFFKNIESIDLESVLPSDFELPDLSLPDKDKYTKYVDREFPLKLRSRDFIGKISFEIFDDTSAKMRFEIFDPNDKGDRISNFASSIRTSEDTNERECLVYNRNVEIESERRKGVGKLSMQVIEEILKKINTEYPNLKTTSIKVITRLGALAKLLVKLNYKPYKEEDGYNAENLVKKNSSDLRDIDYSRDPEVIFVKRV